MIAEKSYRNYAWGFAYRGSAIFSDGSIYEWDVGDNTNSTNFEVENTENWILNNATLSDKKVSQSDINKMLKNIENLEDDITYENVAFDMGSSMINVWKDGKQITLQQEGDSEGKNTTTESKKLIKIINKYLDN